jgi:hypothetical protein
MAGKLQQTGTRPVSMQQQQQQQLPPSIPEKENSSVDNL